VPLVLQSVASVEGRRAKSEPAKDEDR